MKNYVPPEYPSDAQLLVDLAREKRVLLVCAESCTCGSLARALCVPGASDVLAGGFVCYSNEMRVTYLGVKPETLVKHTAVSPDCAIEMAQGAVVNAQRAHPGRKVLGISTTGYVGPNASFAYICIAPSWAQPEYTRMTFNDNDRAWNISEVAQHALYFAFRVLGEKYLGPYIEVREKLWQSLYARARGISALFGILGSDSMIPLETDTHGSLVITRIVPNEYRYEPRVFHRERLGFSAPDPADQRDEQHWLDTAFAPEIEKIMEAYGPSNVSFHWGSIVNTKD